MTLIDDDKIGKARKKANKAFVDYISKSKSGRANITESEEDKSDIFYSKESTEGLYISEGKIKSRILTNMPSSNGTLIPSKVIKKRWKK